MCQKPKHSWTGLEDDQGADDGNEAMKTRPRQQKQDLSGGKDNNENPLVASGDGKIPLVASGEG